MRDKLPWIIRGNIVTVEDQPFKSDKNPIGQEIAIKLGAGISILVDHVLSVNEEGIIVQLVSATTLPDHELQSYKSLNNYVHLQKNEFLCPGMIDLHIHAPQYA